MRMSKYNVEIVPVNKTYLGEGPHWDADKQELFYVDLLKKGVVRYVPSTGEEYRVDIKETGEGWGDSVTFVVPVESHSSKYLIGLGNSVRVMEWDGKSTQLKSPTKRVHVVTENPTGRFNDAKCDPQGRLWAGTMGFESGRGKIDLKKGSLYRLDGHGTKNNGKISSFTCTKHLCNIDISNGLGWSPDGSIFYYIDSFGTWTVDAYDYHTKTGTFSNKRVVFDMKKNGIEGIADGMCVDIDGNLWVAVFGGSKVLHINPKTKQLIDTIELPATNITSVAFGGRDLDVLYITSAQHGLTNEELIAEPAAGALFQVRNTGTKGIPGGSVPFAGKL